MSAATQTPHQDGQDTGGAGPGRLLRSARESAGMSVRDVSAQLRLDERTIGALETDDFAILPAPTFVRGYLRGYARLLGVPVGPVMEAYDREGFAPPDLVADIAEKPQANTGDFPVRLTTLLVIGVLAVLVVLWWNNQAFDELGGTDRVGAGAPAGASRPELADSGATPARPEAGPAPPPPREVADAAASIPTTPPPVAASNTGAGPDGTSRDTSATSTATPTTAAPAPVPAPAQGPAPGPVQPTAGEADRVIARAQDVLERTRSEVNSIVAAAPGGAASGAASVTAPSPEPAPAAPAASAPVTPQPAAAPAPPAGARSGDAHLVLSFPVEAWVEVYDRDDARLYYNLAKPGTELDLSGPPPLRVLLGRTQGVTVTYNGEAVDLGPHTERGVARFTLGQ